LRVEQGEQPREALDVAVVRGRRQEQVVLEVRGQHADRVGPVRVDGVLATPAGGAGVDLVDDQQVEGARVLVRVRWQDLGEQAHGPRTE